MDTRQLIRGTTLYLPVQVEGLFSCGDAHAAQGDGEVCVTGIECPMYAALRHAGRGALDSGTAVPNGSRPADAEGRQRWLLRHDRRRASTCTSPPRKQCAR